MANSSVLICGLGRIGAGADIDAAPNALPLSHLGALRAAGGLSIVALVEPNEMRLRAAIKRWPELKTAQILSDIEAAKPNVAELIVLCGPTEFHRAHFEAAAGLKPKVIILEKPIAPTLGDATAIAQLAGTSDCKIRVNFHRRLDPGHCTVKAGLPAQPPIAVIVRYSNGLYNFASHAMDLITDWFGSVDAVLAASIPFAQDGVGDNTYSFTCKMHDGFIADFVAVPICEYPVFEIEIYYPDKRISFDQGGVRIWSQSSDASAIYQDYPTLGEPEMLKKPGPVGGLTELYMASRDHLARGTQLPGCKLSDAIAGMRVLDAVERCWKEKTEIKLNLEAKQADASE